MREHRVIGKAIVGLVVVAVAVSLSTLAAAQSCATTCSGSGKCVFAFPAAGGSVSGNTSTAANTFSGASCSSLGSGKDHVYQWIPSESGDASVDTCGSSFDTLLSVHTGGCAGPEIAGACNDNSANCSDSTRSRVRFYATAGTTYYIRLDGVASASGAYNLRVRQPCRSTNLQIVPAVGGVVTGTTNGTGALSGTCASSTSAENVYAWTPSETGDVAINTCGSGFDTVLYVRTGNCSGPGVTQVACNDNASGCSSSVNSAVSFTATAGTTYYVVVDGTDGIFSGSYSLSVRQPCGSSYITDVPASGGSFSSSTSGTSAFSGTCDSQSGPEKVFRWTPSVSGTARIDTCGSTLNTALYVRTGSCSGAAVNELTCNDNTASCSNAIDSFVTLNVTAGTTYYIVVDSAAVTFSGSFTLNVNAPPDQCHTLGTCDPATGVCTNPSKPNGTACNDGNACTGTDTCQAGVCSGPPLPNGTACDDLVACTQGDTCQAGACLPGTPVGCHYAVPQSDPTAPVCAGNTRPVGCRAFDCATGLDAGSWVVTPSCTTPSCTQLCPPGISHDSDMQAGHIATCSCSCVDQTNTSSLAQRTLAGCIDPANPNACALMCDGVSPCDPFMSCLLVACFSGAQPIVLMPNVCDPHRPWQAPIVAPADREFILSSGSTATVILGGTPTSFAASGGLGVWLGSVAVGAPIVISHGDVSLASGTIAGLPLVAPRAILNRRAAGTITSVAGLTLAFEIPTGDLFVTAIATVQGRPVAIEQPNTGPIQGSLNLGLGTFALSTAGSAQSGDSIVISLSGQQTNALPTANPTAASYSVECADGLLSGPVTLFGDQSSDSDGSISRYRWSAAYSFESPVVNFTPLGAGVEFTTRLPLGGATVRLTVEDNRGATASAQIAVNVVDTHLPSIVPPAGIVTTVPCATAEASATVNLGLATTSDTCDPLPVARAFLPGPVEMPIGYTSAVVLPVGTTMIRWIAVDAAGNQSASSYQSVTVQCS